MGALLWPLRYNVQQLNIKTKYTESLSQPNLRAFGSQKVARNVYFKNPKLRVKRWCNRYIAGWMQRR
jgi:hypothetical protein